MSSSSHAPPGVMLGVTTQFLSDRGLGVLRVVRSVGATVWSGCVSTAPITCSTTALPTPSQVAASCCRCSGSLSEQLLGRLAALFRRISPTPERSHPPTSSGRSGSTSRKCSSTSSVQKSARINASAVSVLPFTEPRANVRTGVDGGMRNHETGSPNAAEKATTSSTVNCRTRAPVTDLSANEKLAFDQSTPKNGSSRVAAWSCDHRRFLRASLRL